MKNSVKDILNTLLLFIVTAKIKASIDAILLNNSDSLLHCLLMIISQVTNALYLNRLIPD